jgi:hypothetical protein
VLSCFVLSLGGDLRLGYSSRVSIPIDVFNTKLIGDEDEYATIWYFDRQGPIQSSTINILHELPHFLALLFVFQRFNTEDWGTLPHIGYDKNKQWELALHYTSSAGNVKASNSIRDETSGVSGAVNLPPAHIQHVPDIDVWKLYREDSGFCIDETVTMTLENSPLRKPYSIVGRGTWVNLAKLSKKNIGKGALSRHLANEKTFVIKFGWIDALREPEYKSVAAAREIAGDMYAKNLPQVFYAHRYHSYGTSQIRRELGMKETEASTGERVLVILVEKRLDGRLGGLSHEQRLKGLLDCFNGEFKNVFPLRSTNTNGLSPQVHAKVWDGGIHHRDISDGNLMYWMDSDNQVHGVLNDWDLASLGEADRQVGRERTGTIPFMAVDLLLVGNVLHLYRHDVESFVWVVLYWITGGPNGPSKEWMQDHRAAGHAKYSFTMMSTLRAPWRSKADDSILWQIVDVILFTISQMKPQQPQPLGLPPSFLAAVKRRGRLLVNPEHQDDIGQELREMFIELMASGLVEYK